MKRIAVLLICLLATVSLSLQAQERRDNRTSSDSSISRSFDRSMVIRQERTETRDYQSSDQNQSQGRFPERGSWSGQTRDSIYTQRFPQGEQADRIILRLSLTREQRDVMERLLMQRDMMLRERMEAEQNHERRAAAMQNWDSVIKNFLSTEQYERFREIMRQQDVRNRGGIR